MLKEKAIIFRRLLMLFDLFLVGASFFLAYYLRAWLAPIVAFEEYAIFIIPYVLLWGYLLYRAGLYESFRTAALVEILYKIFRAAFFGLLIFSTAVYVFKLGHLSRSFVALAFLLPTALLSVENIFFVLLFRFLRRRGYNYRSILLVGSGRRAQNFIDLVNENKDWGLHIVGIIDDELEKMNTEIKGIKVVGSLKDFGDFIHNNVVDEVVFIVPRSWLDKIQDLVYLCETEGIRANVAVDIYSPRFARARQTELKGFPFFTFDATPSRLWHLFFKRILDIVVSFLGLIILLPVFLVVAILIKLTSPGPVFFSQVRCGLNGRRFRLFKFRTMVVGAEEKLREILDRNEMKGPVFKVTNDPRITPVGRFLRKFSIDELPQLWNVLWGDMSLVGPRPPLPTEVKEYDPWHRRRLSMRPGITCLWQISGRNKIVDFDEWARLDLEYIDRWSLGLDFKILLKTIPAVIFATGK